MVQSSWQYLPTTRDKDELNVFHNTKAGDSYCSVGLCTSLKSGLPHSDVCSYPESRHWPARPARPLCAISNRRTAANSISSITSSRPCCGDNQIFFLNSERQKLNSPSSLTFRLPIIGFDRMKASAALWHCHNKYLEHGAMRHRPT